MALTLANSFCLPQQRLPEQVAAAGLCSEGPNMRPADKPSLGPAVAVFGSMVHVGLPQVKLEAAK